MLSALSLSVQPAHDSLNSYLVSFSQIAMRPTSSVVLELRWLQISFFVAAQLIAQAANHLQKRFGTGHYPRLTV